MSAAPSSLLIVDDDPAVLNSLVFWMELEGFAVTPLADGESVLTRVDIERHDCIVIDHNLPRKNGMQIISALRTRGVATPAVLMTSAPSRALRADADAAHVPIAEKPLLLDDLRVIVARAMRAPADS